MALQEQEIKQVSDAKRGAADVSSNARLLDLHAAAAYLGVSYWTMRDLVNGGQVRRVRLPNAKGHDLRRVLIDRHDLDRWIEESKS
jgi:excisionase family DNA binding protein